MKNTPTSSKKTVKKTAEVIKLGLDIHANKYVVARQIDGSASQSPQRFTAEGFLLSPRSRRGWAGKYIAATRPAASAIGSIASWREWG